MNDDAMASLTRQLMALKMKIICKCSETNHSRTSCCCQVKKSEERADKNIVKKFAMKSTRLRSMPHTELFTHSPMTLSL